MDVPLELSFRGVEKTPDLEQLVEREVDKLHRASRFTSCRVAVEQPHQHQRTHNPYRVRIEVTMPPGKDLVVTKEPRDSDRYDNVSTVIRKAFDAMERQLKETAEKRRGDVKSHAGEATALVSRLFPDEDYGFLQTPDGREIYFHRNAVLHEDYERLVIGTEVRYAETMGTKGPQASTVQIVNKPGATPKS
jgi:cold shock CspA family protein